MALLLRWPHPSYDYAAINCDGSYRKWDGMAGYGIVLRTAEGELLEAVAKCFRMSTDHVREGEHVDYPTVVMLIEMMAIRDGLRLARKLGLTRVQVQSDSKWAISFIIEGGYKGGFCTIGCEEIYRSILEECGWFEDVQFTFVYRECNRAADFLSKLMKKDGEECRLDQSSQLPYELLMIMLGDVYGVATPRTQSNYWNTSTATYAARTVS